ncbi:MAG: hypothetical protein GX421_07505 [Caldisericales bacterium]|nr:hypothetical protein [Caldisericales bacterium]
MGIISDLESFRELVLNGKKAAFSKTILIPEKEAREILERIIQDFPAEFEEASEIVKKRADLIRQAEIEAESIKLNADERAKIIKEATEKAQEIINQANFEASRIIEEAKAESKNMVCQTNDFVRKILEQAKSSVIKSQAILEESIEGTKNANL